MKNLILVSLLLGSLNSFADIKIVSDLDDTIKITNSHHADAVIYGPFRAKVYTGMPEVLRQARSYSPYLHVLSDSPRLVKPTIKKLFKKHKIHVDALTLNGNIHRIPKHEFKIGKLSKMIESSDDQFILLGDDMGEDPEIFDEAMRRFPGRVLAAYIHVVENRSIPSSVIPYLTSFDLALRENMAGRMEEASVVKVAKEVMNPDEPESVFPDFAFCPTDKSLWDWQEKSNLAELTKEVTAKMLQLCSNPR